ncbi:DUF1493 family protein [Tenacibaculum maritimum]|nr:DUF1493 family protein [Tenacibaculum maritimum]
MESLFEKIKKFIIEERWEYGFELTTKTSLQEDLDIYGDDASEILIKFCNEFNVNYEKFRFDDYFRPESSWIDFFKKKKKYKKFTISNLIKAIESGELK